MKLFKKVTKKLKKNLKPKKSGMYYLAGPYTSEHSSTVTHRRLDHLHAEYWLMTHGIDVIAPINSSGSLEQIWDLPIQYEFWQRRDRKSIRYSDGVIVIMMPGWEESVGVTDEIQYAKSKDKPVYYIKPEYDRKTHYIKTFHWSRA